MPSDSGAASHTLGLSRIRIFRQLQTDSVQTNSDSTGESEVNQVRESCQKGPRTSSGRLRSWAGSDAHSGPKCGGWDVQPLGAAASTTRDCRRGAAPSASPPSHLRPRRRLPPSRRAHLHCSFGSASSPPPPMAARVPLRVEVRDVLSLHRDGRHDEALRRALTMVATKRNHCALVMNLAANLLLESHLRNLGPNPSLARKHLKVAAMWYEAAAAEAPNCVETAAAHVTALLALELHSEAEVAFVRGMAIAAADDPLLHNAAADGANRTREDRIRIAGEKLRVAGEELRRRFHEINAGKEDDDIAQVLTLMESSGVDSAFVAAVEVAKRFPFSARAQLLRVHMEIELARALSRDSKKKKEILGRAAKSMGAAANTFQSSLVIAIYHAKLLIVLGEYEAAETECNRALRIEDPMLDAQRQWTLMTKDDQENLLRVHVETLISHYRSSNQSAADTISDAVFQFKRHGAWSLWICPLPDCNGCCTPKFQDLTQHLLQVHFQGFSKNLVAVMDEKLKVPGNAFDGPTPFDVLSLCQDSEERDIFCFTELEDMLHSVVLLSSGAEPSSVQEMRAKKCREAAATLKGLHKELKTFPARKSGAKVHKAVDTIQKLWMKLLEASCRWCHHLNGYGEIKKCSEKDKDVSRTGSYHMDVSDAVFLHCLGISDRSLSVEHGSKPFHENKNHQNGFGKQQDLNEDIIPRCDD
ncbi:hypothetical protein ACP70R_016863 [Stipagrostis hirtigluma subsp. patula]